MCSSIYPCEEMEAFSELVQIIIAIGLCGMSVSMIVFGLCITGSCLINKRLPTFCRQMDIFLCWNHKLLHWSFYLFGAGIFIMMIWGMLAGFISLLTKSQ